jgi:hypothetical protein
MKIRSGPKTPPIRTECIIQDHARLADGPDTPMPSKTSFMKSFSPTELLQRGSLQLQDAMEKAKEKALEKAKVRSRAEKRRESIRKNIKVIGNADQSPNGLVTQWV